MKNKSLRTGVLYLVLLAALAIVLGSQLSGNTGNGKPVELSTSKFVTAVNENRVTEVTYKATTGVITGSYWEDNAAKSTGEDALTRFSSTYVGEDSLAQLMADHPDIDYSVDVTSNSIWLTLLTTFLPLLLLLAIMWFFFGQMTNANNSQMKFGKAKTKMIKEDRPKTKFSDVAGIDEAVEELDEIKEFLSNPAKFQAMGAKIPRGVLLVGPPGTGKTLLARAVAGEAGVPFFSTSGSDFVEMFVGVGASRVR
ncbi:MAG: ATP-dependent metallopeptidase FtsH/Yme1/Tma family protein, partial [Coriobacteriales bacterium]|nr:ATP-dependent metallopeptidase FtsH/Yme1/Tma family protein [Coriobacteriales bacterium]